ncbi:TadE family protein [Microbacterium sp. BWT-B31]|uniref:TadE family protein n=1 Tax=Microbacterium sp. BWT-B31 TaxID=3232072 RepID=UPI003529ABC9
MARLRRALADAHLDDAGSSPVEFVLVGSLLTFLTLAVMQFGLAVYVRNVVQDAAVEGAFHAALADSSIEDGVQRTERIVARAVGPQFAESIEARETDAFGYPAVEITVSSTLPILGLLGVPRTMEVTAHAPLESFD